MSMQERIVEGTRVHGEQGFGERNELANNILDFALAFNLVLANIYFMKRYDHLITYKSGNNRSQIDLF